MLSTDCLCIENAAGYAHNPSCPAATKIPFCEDCGHSGYCTCVYVEPKPRDPNAPDPWAEPEES
ncbi:hypothetical protein PQD13_gp33 [Gordonia phage Clawz]|uniref:Uncharacterized protein n=1 Tax=Gordonia phage Clawz TaxID=2743910 RepID=A0AAE7K6W7_9CAUD|nr:hypothetical protein PQD13_gp33 [Gordonia phage Clawz]QKY79945.1 hypothetical protein SEA_CLAWZ_33 [Gordonia phage Clawz]